LQREKGRPPRKRGSRQCPAENDSLGGLFNPERVMPGRFIVQTDIDVN
jgi:hypothetical protein